MRAALGMTASAILILGEEHIQKLNLNRSESNVNFVTEANINNVK